MTVGTREDILIWRRKLLDRTKRTNRFGRGFGPVVWQITDDDNNITILLLHSHLFFCICSTFYMQYRCINITRSSVLVPSWGWRLIAETCKRVHVYGLLIPLLSVCVCVGEYKCLQAQCTELITLNFYLPEMLGPPTGLLGSKLRKQRMWRFPELQTSNLTKENAVFLHMTPCCLLV